MTLALNQTPVRVARLFADVATIHIRVTAGTVRIGPEQSDLEIWNGGFFMVAGDGLQHFDWRKPELWMMADTATATVEMVIA